MKSTGQSEKGKGMTAVLMERQCDGCYEHFSESEMVECDWGWACRRCAELGEPPEQDDPDEDGDYYV